ncbi:MAG: Fic family protein [Saprospiraceae bacterium]|nr:Fic family protein [Saprospiraceae bacterium]
MEKKLRFDFKTAQKLFAAAARIDQFKGKWQQLEKKNNRYLRELRTIATIQSIGSSTRIEGATLSNAEVESLLKNVKVTTFKTRDEQEVAGYYEVLELILSQFAFIELSVGNIKSLHNQLLKYSDKDQRHKGAFKQFTNKVVATYPDGSQRTIFNTTEPLLTDKEMDELLDWTNRELANKDFHSLFVIAAFVYEFLSIHPFQDGNGRLSRLLSTLLLLREGYHFVQYISFENIVERRKSDYYRSLMAGQPVRGTEAEIISEWMQFFLECLEELIQKLDEKYERYLTTKGYINERQRSLLEFVRQRGVIRLPDAVQQFGDVSDRTLKRDLLLLESESLIEKTGRGKSVAYRAIKDSD